MAGFERSYFSFYVCFGWMLSAYLFGHAIFYWQLASIVDLVGRKLAGIVGVLTIEALSTVAVSSKYLF